MPNIIEGLRPDLSLVFIFISIEIGFKRPENYAVYFIGSPRFYMGCFLSQIREGRTDHGSFSLPESPPEGTSVCRGCLSLNRTNREAKGRQGLLSYVYEQGGDLYKLVPTHLFT
jgi:hypothetical protein